MPKFAEYARYYDLFYNGKDYQKEVAYVLALLEESGLEGKKLLEFGCGSGGHAVYFAEEGYSVHGIDRSAHMVRQAVERFEPFNQRGRGPLSATLGDVSEYTATDKYDAVVSLFHVANYQATPETLAGFFRSARHALDTGGLFLFDFWNGAAVLKDPPQPRLKRASTGSELVTRQTTPLVLKDLNVVDVRFDFVVKPFGSTDIREFSETHRMRYIFCEEVDELAKRNGFQLKRMHSWLSEKAPSTDDWYACAVLAAV